MKSSDIRTRIQTRVHADKFCMNSKVITYAHFPCSHTHTHTCAHTHTHTHTHIHTHTHTHTHTQQSIQRGASQPAHPDTAKRIYDQRVLHQCVWASVDVCVCKGEMDSVRLHLCFKKRQTDLMCVHVSVCVCVFKAFRISPLHRLCTTVLTVQKYKHWYKFCGSFCSKQYRKGSC